MACRCIFRSVLVAVVSLYHITTCKQEQEKSKNIMAKEKKRWTFGSLRHCVQYGMSDYFLSALDGRCSRVNEISLVILPISVYLSASFSQIWSNLVL